MVKQHHGCLLFHIRVEEYFKKITIRFGTRRFNNHLPENRLLGARSTSRRTACCSP